VSYAIYKCHDCDVEEKFETKENHVTMDLHYFYGIEGFVLRHQGHRIEIVRRDLHPGYGEALKFRARERAKHF